VKHAGRPAQRIIVDYSQLYVINYCNIEYASKFEYAYTVVYHNNILIFMYHRYAYDVLQLAVVSRSVVFKNYNIMDQ